MGAYLLRCGSDRCARARCFAVRQWRLLLLMGSDPRRLACNEYLSKVSVQALHVDSLGISLPNYA